VQGSDPVAKPPDGTPRWPALLRPRLATPPDPPPVRRADAELWQADLQGSLIALLAPETIDPASFPVFLPRGRCATTILWISDDRVLAPAAERAALGTCVIDFSPAGVDLGFRSPRRRRYAAQNAIMLGRSLLGYAVEDLVWASQAARAAGATHVVAVCDGPQAALACLGAAAPAHGPDAFVVRGLPGDFRGAIARDPAATDTDEGDPYGMFVTPDLGAIASPDMLLAQVAPRPLAIVDADAATFPFAATIYQAEDAAAALSFRAGSLARATRWAVDRLQFLE
jgi:hypothetical protein